MELSLRTNEAEYWHHVSDQNEIPIAGKTKPMFDVSYLNDFLTKLPKESKFYDYMHARLSANPDLLHLMRTLAGVSDKRMYLELSYIFSKTPKEDDPTTSICGCSAYDLNKHPLSFFKNLITGSDEKVAGKATELICMYLVNRKIYDVLETLSGLSPPQTHNIFAKLILTKEFQQQEAKRRGHGAEFEMAKAIHNLGADMIPEDRYLRPMGSKDPNVDKNTFEIREKRRGKTWSFDLIILKEKTPAVFVQALIHTSDPGQYGVNKSNETVLVKRSLEAHNRKYKQCKELWGLVDGVGFCENKKDTINKMLDEFDNFIQLKSLYKIGLKLHKAGLARIKGIMFDRKFYSNKDAADMFEKYGSSDIRTVGDRSEGANLGREIEAGKAWLYVDSSSLNLSSP